MRLLICGSRTWLDPAPIERVIVAAKREAARRGEGLVIIHGHCPDGADHLADRLAQRHGLSVDAGTLIRVPADWDQHGKAAGPIRNARMAREYHPDVVYAFRAHGKSTGTDGMVKIARRMGIKAYVVTPGGFGRASESANDM